MNIRNKRTPLFFSMTFNFLNIYMPTQVGRSPEKKGVSRGQETSG
jgi:hypothetical protein